MEFDVKILDQRLWDQPMQPTTAGSAGLDLRACIEAPLVFKPGDQVTLPAGFAVHIKNPTIAGLVVPRSGLGTKHGITLANTVGLIDSDYQGEILVALRHTGKEPYTIRPLERIAQLVLVAVFQFCPKFVPEFLTSERGAGGFGSTGTK